MNATALILPGLGNSGPEHWQSHWERRDPGCHRVLQDDWDQPTCVAWVSRLTQAVRESTGPVVLVAHSTACALVAHWAAGADATGMVRGALLVAPSDPTGSNYPAGPGGFHPVPMRRLPFPSVVVASDDDRYVSPRRAREYAAAWGADFVMLENAGHINAASGHGPWPEGFVLLDALRRPAPYEDSHDRRLCRNA